MKDLITTWEASCELANHLPIRTTKQWFAYLMKNPSQYRNQDGYKITVHTLNGERRYTKFALAAFITAHRNGDELKFKGKSND